MPLSRVPGLQAHTATPCFPFHYLTSHLSFPPSVTESLSFPLRLLSGLLISINHVLPPQLLRENTNDRLGTESEVENCRRLTETAHPRGACVFKNWGEASLIGSVLSRESRTGAWPGGGVGGTALCGRGPGRDYLGAESRGAGHPAGQRLRARKSRPRPR